MTDEDEWEELHEGMEEKEVKRILQRNIERIEKLQAQARSMGITDLDSWIKRQVN